MSCIVISENGKYLLSRWDRKENYIGGKPVPNEKETVEITEAEYREIMDVDYHKIIEEYYATPRLPIMDGFNYDTKFTYADGSTSETNADMISVLVKMMRFGNM